ncbi:MAG: NnrS family protein [Thiohalorhabdaceae bacterium]
MLGLLLFVMGGRFLASVASGRHQARGRWLVRLSQPRRERAGVKTLLAMALLDVLAVVAGLAVTLPGVLALLGSVLIVARLGGWRGWRLLDDPQTGVLQAGYLWLGAGLALKGAVQMAGVVFPVGALHVLLVGGLGTLTLAVMTRVLRSRRGLMPPLPPVAAMAAALVSVAAVARIAAWVGPEAPLWLGAAGLAWCLAWILFLAGPVRNHSRASAS